MYFDYTYILIIISVIISGIASARVNSAFSKYSGEMTRRGVPAYMAARQALDAQGLTDVPVEPIEGSLTDHYDPREKVVRLSQSVYNSTSVAAVSVALHETGHAMQDAEDYAPLRWRSAIAPIAQFGSYASWILILLGVFFSYFFIRLGIWVFVAVVAFQLVTLPVEFNASARALAVMEGGGYLYDEEMEGAKKVLSAAALTYVAAALTAMLQLLRLVILFGRRD